MVDRSKPHAVYWIYAGDTIMYIGMAHDPSFRVSQHRGRHHWTDVTRIELKWYDNWATAAAAETAAIREHRPPWNTAHAGRIPLSKGSGLADWICEQIRFGEWEVGDHIKDPAEWTTPGFGLGAIRKALTLLLDRGLLCREDGRVFVAADACERLAALPDDRGPHAYFRFLDRVAARPEKEGTT